MSDKPTTEWPDGLAEAIPDDVATDRSGLVKDEVFRVLASPLAAGAGQTGETVKAMGYSARQNETARKAAAGELLSRRSLMGAMDHALEIHASALRLLEAKNVALGERVTALEAEVRRLKEERDEAIIGREVDRALAKGMERLPTICATCGAQGPSGYHHVHDALDDGPAYWVAPTEQT